MQGLLRNIAADQGTANRVVQDLSSKITGGGGVELSFIYIKNVRDCETEYKNVVQGNSTTTMIRTISTIRHVRIVTTSIYIID